MLVKCAATIQLFSLFLVFQISAPVQVSADAFEYFHGQHLEVLAASKSDLFADNGPLVISRMSIETMREKRSRTAFSLEGDNSADKLRALIAHAEAGSAGYDAVHHSAVRPPASPTRMTVREIYRWIAATPGRNHAIGRYQFIPSTLRRLMEKAGISPDSRFSPALQDRLANILLEEAGMSSFLRGRISNDRFMDNLALIWAGLPTSSGRSAYHGFAGNRAAISRAYFEQAFAEIFR